MVFPHLEVGDFYHRYRPCKWEEVLGQDFIIKSIKNIISSSGLASRSLMFFGSSGTGKTTAARILAMSLCCKSRKAEDLNPCLVCDSCRAALSGSHMDIMEINASDMRGIDTIREMREGMLLRSFFGENKVYILDECHSLTKDAQQSLLKVLEEAPKSVYIILISTEPTKLLPTVRNRCQKFEFKRVANDVLVELMSQVCIFEGLNFNRDILDRIAENSFGSPRNGLVYLQQVVQAGLQDSKDLTNIDDIISVISDDNKDGIRLCLALIKRGRWSEISLILSELIKSKVSIELIRYTILGFFRNKLLKATDFNQSDTYSKVMELMINPFFDTKPENGLVLSTYKAWVILKGK